MPLEGLSLENRKAPRVPYRSGMVLLATGLRACIFALLIGQKETDALYPLLGLASIPALIGAALIINDRPITTGFLTGSPIRTNPGHNTDSMCKVGTQYVSAF